MRHSQKNWNIWRTRSKCQFLECYIKLKQINYSTIWNYGKYLVFKHFLNVNISLTPVWISMTFLPVVDNSQMEGKNRFHILENILKLLNFPFLTNYISIGGVFTWLFIDMKTSIVHDV